MNSPLFFPGVESALSTSYFNPFFAVFWPLVLSMCALGVGLLLDRNSKQSLVVQFSLGFAMMGLLSTYLLMFGGGFRKGTLWTVLSFSLLGLWRIYRYISCLKISQVFGKGRIVALAIFLMLLTSYLRMLCPNGGAETFQYHFYVPRLYLEQQTLFLTGYDFYRVFMNVWGFESSLVISCLAGGLQGMLMHVWVFYILFAFQICASAKICYPDIDRRFVFWMLLLSSSFTYLLWWTKPEFVVTGYLSIILAMLLIRKSEIKLFQMCILVSFMLTLKITCVILIPVIFILLCIRRGWINTFISCFITLLLILPWVVFLYRHTGALGALPADNTSSFIAPVSEHVEIVSSILFKYLRDLKDYYSLFKPSIFLYLLGVPFCLWHWKKYWTLLVGVLVNVIAAWLLVKSDTPFSDEFRYTCFTLFVMPMGAALILGKMRAYKWIFILMIFSLTLISGKRLYEQNYETWKYHRSYLLGDKSMAQALQKEGAPWLDIYLNLRKESDGRLLHYGNGNYVMHHESVIHVHSWTKEYPLWKFHRLEDLKQWLKENHISWLLLERWRYESFARGFGGKDYVNTMNSIYYKETLKTLDLAKDYIVAGSDERYSLYYFP